MLLHKRDASTRAERILACVSGLYSGPILDFVSPSIYLVWVDFSQRRAAYLRRLDPRGAPMNKPTLGALAALFLSFFPAGVPAQDKGEVEALRLIEKAGGVVARDPKAKGNPIVGVN